MRTTRSRTSLNLHSLVQVQSLRMVPSICRSVGQQHGKTTVHRLIVVHTGAKPAHG